MANELNIDRLSIEIKADADKASSSLDKLIKSLENLGVAASSLTGLRRVSSQLSKLNEVVSKTKPTGFQELVNHLNELSKIKLPNYNKTANSLSKLTKSINEISNINDLSSFSSKINKITESIKPLETLGKNTLAPFISSLRAIPKVTDSIDVSTMNRFRQIIIETVAAIGPLTTEVNRSERGLTALNGILRATTGQNGNLASSNAALVRSYTSLGSIISTVRAKLAIYFFAARRLSSVLGGVLQTSNQYVEDLNLFTVSMGSAADEAFRFAEEVNNALNIDVGEFIRNQGYFRSILSGFGVVSDKANLMSKNLTQIGYDISSFYNVNIDAAMQKVQSGISGELEPLRRLGYALDAVTLQQIAYNNGITQNINTMTQAQKAQLRYVAILQQSKNVMGDMARTIATPANSMRILKQQMTQLKRAIGDILSIFAAKLIPYIQVGIRLLTDFANWLASVLGFKLPTIDYSGMEDGITGLSEDAEAATDAVNETVKAVQRLAGFDEINVLKSAKEDADDTANALSNQFDLGIDLPEYDFLKGVENQTEELYQKAKKWLQELYGWLQKHKKMILTISGLLAALWAVKKVSEFTEKVKGIYKAFKDITKLRDFGAATSFLGSLKSVLTGAGFGILGGVFSYDFFKTLKEGTLDWKSALIDTLGVVGSIAAAFALGGPIAGAITIFGTLVGAVAAFNDVAGVTFEESLPELFDNNGVKVSALTKKFKEQYLQVEETSNKIHNYVSELDSNKSKITEAQKKIELLTQSIRASNGEMSREQAEEIKQYFETIGAAIKNNIGAVTQGILESFSATISNTAQQIGVDLGAVIANIQGFEKTLTGNVDKAQKIINNYTDKLLDGATPSKQETAEYENAWAYFMEKARDTSEYMQFQDAMKTDFSKIDFGNKEKIIEQLENITNTARDARKSVEATYQDALSLITSQETEATTQYKYGFIDYDRYNAMIKEFNNVRSLLKSDRDSQINEIEYNYSAITGAMQNQVDEQIRRYGELITAQQKWASIGLSERPEVWSEALRNDINTFRKTQYTEWDGTVKDANDLWEEWYSSNVFDAKYRIDHLDEKINDYAAKVDILPNKRAGKEWLQSMVKNSQAELPSVLKQMDYIMFQIRNEIDKEGKLAYMPSAEIEKLVRERYNSLGAAQKAEYLKGFDLEGINSTINASLGNIGAEAGYNLGSSLSNALGAKIKEILDAFTMLSKAVPMLSPISSVSNSISSTIFKLLGIRGYAAGGMPVNGDLFFANENGKAEFISSIGKRTAVANQQQMRSEIRQGVKEGMVEALRTQSNSNGDIYIFMDSEQIGYKMQRVNAQKSKMTGGK